MSDVLPPIPGLDLIGRGFDALTLDPLSINSAASIRQAIVFSQPFTGMDHSGKYSVPAGITETGLDSADVETENRSFVCATEFTDEMRTIASVDASCTTAFDFSLSGSVSEVATATQTRSQASCIVRATRRLYQLVVDLENTSLKVSADFAATVAALPLVADGALTGANAQASVAGQAWAAPYLAIVRTYGSLVSMKISMGGFAWQKSTTQVTESGFTRDMDASLKTEAEITVDAFFSGGASLEVAQKKAEAVDLKNRVERSEVHFRGGTNPSMTETRDDWLQSIPNAPVVVDGSFVSIADLLTARFFPDDPLIADKQSILRFVADNAAAASGTLRNAVQRYGDEVAIYAVRPVDKSLARLVVETTGGTSFLRLAADETDAFISFSLAHVLTGAANVVDTATRAGTPVMLNRTGGIVATIGGQVSVLVAPEIMGTANDDPRLRFVPLSQSMKVEPQTLSPIVVFLPPNYGDQQVAFASVDVPVTIWNGVITPFQGGVQLGRVPWAVDKNGYLIADMSWSDGAVANLFYLRSVKGRQIG